MQMAIPDEVDAGYEAGREEADAIVVRLAEIAILGPLGEQTPRAVRFAWPGTRALSMMVITQTRPSVSVYSGDYSCS